MISNPMHFKHGFSLVESLVAIAILLTAIVGPLSIANSSFFSARYSRDQVSAFYLAQESIEYIRYVRDTNSLANTPNWLAGLENCDGRICRIDVPNNTVTVCGGNGVCPYLKYDTSAHLYNYVTGSDTLFRRAVNITCIGGANCTDSLSNEAMITVTIDWRNGPINRTFTIRDSVYKWQR